MTQRTKLGVEAATRIVAAVLHARGVEPGPEDAAITRELAGIELEIEDDPARNGGTRTTVRSWPYASIAPEELRWLWEHRIPLGKVTLLFGDPNLGKSLLTLHIASSVSRGGVLPDGATAVLGHVVLVSAEDDPADTIRPRLDAAGADVARVHALGVAQGWLSLADDLDALESEIRQIGDVKLVVIDPVSAYLGRADSHNNAEVRALIGPLTDMAQRTGVAVVLVTHLNKGGSGKGMYRATGSLAFVAAARAAWAVVAGGQDPGRRLFLPAKNNLGPPVPGLAYRVEVSPNGSPVLCWESEPVQIGLDEALAADAASGADEGSSAVAEAARFLEAELADGPRLRDEIAEAAKEAGHAWRTVERASRDLHIQKRPDGSRGRWVWSLPAPSPPTSTPGRDVGGHGGDGGHEER